MVWENSRGPRITKYNQSMASKSFNKSFEKKWVRFFKKFTYIYTHIIYKRLVIVNLKTGRWRSASQLIIIKILGSLNRN